MAEEIVIAEAEFTPKVCIYWLLSGAIVIAVTVVGIPLLIIWFPVGFIFTRHYLDSMKCVLTNKVLRVNKGVLTKTEKTIPLEKITDLGLVQGPVMRAFGIEQLSIETAGQSGVGALVSLQGIVDAKAFRKKVLDQRDRLSELKSSGTVKQESGEAAGSLSILTDIKDSLNRIEKILQQKQ